jgi:hypothetical protein
MRIDTIIKGTKVNDPLNIKELSIQLNFDKNNIEFRTSVPRLQFGVGGHSLSDGSFLLNDEIIGGANGRTNGVFEGVPLELYLKSEGKYSRIFDGVVDLTTASIGCEKIEADCIETTGIDVLKDLVNSFSYEYLYSIGKITSKNFVGVPYICNNIPSASDAVMATVSVFTMGFAIKEQVQALAEFISGLANPFEFTNILRIIARVLYLGLLVYIIIQLILDLFEYLIQPIKYHVAMSLREHFDIASAHLGYGFKSNILNGELKNLYIIPERFALEDNGVKKILGFKKKKKEQKGFYNGTFGDLLREISTIFNCDVWVENNYICLDKKNIKISKYELPNVELPSYALNTNEIIANKILAFNIDTNDKNTIQNYYGTSCQVILEPISFSNKKNILLKNFVEERTQFARGFPKKSLTTPEIIMREGLEAIDVVMKVVIAIITPAITVINKLIDTVNNIIDKLNKIGIKIKAKLERLKKPKHPNFSEAIDNRKGMLEIENDFIAVPKLVLLDINGGEIGGTDDKLNKISANNSTILDAGYIYNNYHSVESLVNGNQYRIYSGVRVPFTVTDYYDVLDSNQIQDGELLSVDWNIYEQVATISFKKRYIYTKNLKETKIVPDGK